MTSPNVTPPPKRLHILDNEEIEALYGRPCFTGDERIHVLFLAGLLLFGVSAQATRHPDRLPLPVVLCCPSLSAFQRQSAHLFHSAGEAVLRRIESHSKKSDV